jgi:hypothetical protein
MSRLTDKDPFPFGTHKGKQLIQVPASYLLSLTSQSWLVRWPQVREYIDRNRDVLEKEVDDPKSYGTK